MRVGLISDLHGNRAGTAAALRLLEGCATTVCCGDIFNQYGGDPAVVDLLRAHGVVAVAGNHDTQFVRSAPPRPAWEAARAYLAALPAQATLDLAGVRLTVVHGAPWDAHPGVSTYLFPHMLDASPLAGEDGVVAVGHTHLPYVRQAGGGAWVISPGSCGVVDAQGQLHAAVLDLARGEVVTYAFRLEGPDAGPQIVDERRAALGASVRGSLRPTG